GTEHRLIERKRSLIDCDCLVEPPLLTQSTAERGQRLDELRVSLSQHAFARREHAPQVSFALFITLKLAQEHPELIERIRDLETLFAELCPSDIERLLVPEGRFLVLTLEVMQ